MAVICNTCGLPDDLCACGDLDKDSTHIIIRLETRRFRKKGTMIEGLDPKINNLGNVARELKEIKAQGEEPFDLVVSDIQMPDRNGYEVFSAVRRCHPETQVILMTGFGYDPHHSIVRASQEGLKSVLFKPFEIELLMVQVREALAGSDS